MASGVSVRGIPQLRARLAGLSKARGQLTREWAIKTTALAKVKHRPNKKTGVTSASIAPRLVTPTRAEVKAGGAAVFLEQGTKPHDIVPRRRKALRFADTANGGSARLSGAPRTGSRVVFRKRVHHPGTRAYPFMRPAAREAAQGLGVGTLVDAWNESA